MQADWRYLVAKSIAIYLSKTVEIEGCRFHYSKGDKKYIVIHQNLSKIDAREAEILQNT